MDIFVGSLPFKLKETELKQLFESYGEVTSAKIIIDQITRQNKGFGFVEMPNDNEAEKAIAALNGSELSGRTIVVNKSEKRERGPRDARDTREPREARPPRPTFNTPNTDRDRSPGNDRNQGFVPPNLFTGEIDRGGNTRANSDRHGKNNDSGRGKQFYNDKEKGKGFGGDKKGFKNHNPGKGGGSNRLRDFDADFDY